MMSILGTLFIGLIVGFIARAVKPGDDKLGWIKLCGQGARVLSNRAGSGLCRIDSGCDCFANCLCTG